ncbi:MAG: SGNH/GDSL hydrolase family protein [Frankiales bacterium]|nr:SGNH/GDSL hydrolase family protein [Frankiales bacterium]
MNTQRGVRPQLPWPAGRRPLSVVAFGNSVTFMQMPAAADRGQGNYLEVLADCLAERGVPVTPHLEGKWFDFLHRALRDYETRVRSHVPDVLIVQFGLNEYQPWLVPIWLIRHLMVQHRAVGRFATRYRRHIARPAWKQVRGYRRRVAPLVGVHTWQTTPRRFAGHLRRLIRTVRSEGKPLILVLDIDEPSGTLAHFLPNLEPRHAIYQERIARVVASFDAPDVRLVKVSELTRGGGVEMLPDGMHYSPDTHRRVGELLAGEVVAWLEQQRADAAKEST